MKGRNRLISTITSILNKERIIESVLKIFRKQSACNFAIAVVDGGRVDDTVKRAMEIAEGVTSDGAGIAYEINIRVKHTTNVLKRECVSTK